MRFSKVLPVLFDELEKGHVDFSLIGGVALYFSGTPRTTFDVDFLILSAQSDEVQAIMSRLGYERLHQSEDVAQYSSKDPDQGQVDFLLAHRKYATAMLRRAKKTTVFGKQVKILAPEDLIGLKVQSSANDPQRAAKDKADIEDLVKHHAKTLDWELVEEYFKLFQRESELAELKKRFL